MSTACRLLENMPLETRNTFGVRANARWWLEVADAGSLPSALALLSAESPRPLVIGGGSNLLLAGDIDTPLLAMTGRGIRMLERHESHGIVRAEAGVPWHGLVMWTLSSGLAGLENLALIPGNAGAAPVQNIGAYGTEAGEFVHAVDAFDLETGATVRLTRQDCRFGYRDSLFKHHPGRYIVTSIELALPWRHELRLDYAGIREELAAMDITAPTPRDVAEAVIRIRTRKLPDPAVIGNAGSFFKNPVAARSVALALTEQHPGLPMYPSGNPDTAKLSAAWMIEACGWKGFREGDAGVSAAHALVLVNHGHASGSELLALARRIAASVEQRFGIALEPEPVILGADWSP